MNQPLGPKRKLLRPHSVASLQFRCRSCGWVPASSHDSASPFCAWGLICFEMATGALHRTWSHCGTAAFGLASCKKVLLITKTRSIPETCIQVTFPNSLSSLTGQTVSRQIADPDRLRVLEVLMFTLFKPR